MGTANELCSQLKCETYLFVLYNCVCVPAMRRHVASKSHRHSKNTCIFYWRRLCAIGDIDCLGIFHLNYFFYLFLTQKFDNDVDGIDQRPIKTRFGAK